MIFPLLGAGKGNHFFDWQLGKEKSNCMVIVGDRVREEKLRGHHLSKQP